MDADLIQTLNDAQVEVGLDPETPPPATVVPPVARVDTDPTPDPMRAAAEQSGAASPLKPA